MIYRKFKLADKDYAGLLKDELEMLPILEEVVADIAKVYEVQVKDGFYPKGVGKERVEAAAKVHALILSPFTFIEEKDGHLCAVPYHEKYAALLKPISEKIEKAAALSKNTSFKKYLKARAKSLLDGSFKEADIAWLDVRNSNIDFSAGPFERYLDKVLFIKRVYQAHVGIIDREMTDKVEKATEVLYSSAKMSFDRAHSTDIPKKGVTVVVENTPATSGYVADIVFSGEHFPSDLDIVQEHGSKVIIYSTQLKLKFEKQMYPIFTQIFEKKFASKYSKEQLLQATAWLILLHEVGRQLHKYIGARERLKELFGIIDEANTSAAAVQHSKYLLVKGLITSDELEAIIITHIVRMFADLLIYREEGINESHVKGDAIALNTYLKSGALKEQKGISWPNFARIFFEVEQLADILVNILQNGDYKEADKYIKGNASLENLQKLSKGLKKLNLKL